MDNTRWRSRRLDRLGSAIFAEVAAWKAEARREGKDVIALDIGSPDQPPSLQARETLAAAALRPDAYRYPGTEGTIRFRETVARWFGRRFGVAPDPAEEVLSLMGTQDGLAHLAMSIADPGDAALLPDPGYPVYQAGLAVADVEAIPLPLSEDNGYLPDFDAVPEAVWDRVKFLILNYPSNPLSAVADLAFFERAVDTARRRNVLLVHDNAYSEMAYDGFRPPSVLEVPGAFEVAVEFHSLSKSFHLAGGRLGFAVGNREALSSLRALKNNIDFGVFLAVQEAGIAALEMDMAGHESVSLLYEKRRDVFVAGLRNAGWNVPSPKATMFLWAPVPAGWSSRQFSREMLAQAGVASIPGNAFGVRGEGYVRLALVETESRLTEAAERIGTFLRSAEPKQGETMV
ncbi:aminotransferase class I/II-fold pyridoxal phosphate-dependent enzyme [Cohnella sp. CFH 77786]|uniref:aminotransferase class I/II-fold pyridoxal phosphate-dependent enzyme n=1 Tax=Cohnella sp. CFH 77786 TaxID=2662265 RepID=UPI001C60FD4A|nr:aminotransferase class I/II-fold pyridoxal phosphate-dependent enzyme [Cohnella sp. CFH 77786]MBW5446938.1 aminotransferase class I/II-fold pyridoxal phosphate-dependent enzyme [Cohnella sp. CFH 77786]